MSNVARLRELTPARCQLPVAWYFDTAIFELEKKLLFDAGANYVGHELMVPNVGDYYTLAWTDHAKMLVRNAAGVELLSNVCRHRQAIMLEGHGNAENIVCPVHRWTYDLKGELLGAPFFPESPCVKLHSTPLINWNGLLFAGPRDPRKDLARVTTMADWDFSGYVLDSVRVDEYDINWKTFMETYLEVCLQQLDGREPKQGALWASYFPGLTFEWYPNVLVVSNLIARSPPKKTNVVEFYYPEEIAYFERDFVEAQQAAYVETALEDKEICERLDRGRRALYEQGLDDAGPYQSPMEDAEAHFHEWLHRKLGR